jgi:pimeloyl-ACP methyl ester carboxylesterase
MSRVDVNGVGIEYQVTGQGRPVVLLHGFPDSGRLWRHQVTALAGAGFGVIVPDLRGYGRSDKPEAVEAYSLALLAGDVMAILAAEGIDRAHIVGHDWGAALAWALASLAPALTEVQMTDSAKNVAGPWRYERLDGPGHWMQLEAPDRVNELLLDFLPR